MKKIFFYFLLAGFFSLSFYGGYPVVNPSQLGANAHFKVEDGGVLKVVKVDSFYNANAINAVAQSNYCDIGNTRIQWGSITAAGGGVVTLPMPYQGNLYTVAMSPSNEPANVNIVLQGYCKNRTTTSFTAVTKRYDVSSGTSDVSNQGFTWVSIGAKP